MQELTHLLDSVLQQTRFDVGEQSFSADQLRGMHVQGVLSRNIRARLAIPVVPESMRATLVEKLRQILSEYIDSETECVGFGLRDLMGGTIDHTIPYFAYNLVRAASTLGSKRAVQILSGWIEGEPFRYQSKALLTGVTVDRPLVLKEGLRITQLPKSLDELYSQVPLLDLHMHMHGISDLLGGVMLSVNCTATPTLYRLRKDEFQASNFHCIWELGEIPGLSLDTFCDALSLACNHCVRWNVNWGDYGDLEEFSPMSVGTRFVNIRRGVTTCLSQKHLDQARDILIDRHNGRAPRGLSTAISRWINSKSFETRFLDRFIELRIALEALYLKNTGDGKGFRLASYGAWHLGDSPGERRRYYDTLRRVYSRASNVVHAGDIQDKPETRDLLAAAQDACREGILKRLKEPAEPNWDEVILGV